MNISVTDVGIWAIVALLAFVAYIVWQGLKITRVQHEHAMAALASLGDTHRIGFEALSMNVQRLENRVKELENNGGRR